MSQTQNEYWYPSTHELMNMGEEFVERFQDVIYVIVDNGIEGDKPNLLLIRDKQHTFRKEIVKVVPNIEWLHETMKQLMDMENVIFKARDKFNKQYHLAQWQHKRA